MNKRQYPEECCKCKIYEVVKKEKLIMSMCCYGCPNRRRINRITDTYCKKIN
ncbi:hypothetical protein H2684_03505 [Clostridium sp. cel8]|uniref:hypothetical protein n=1 Tax=unclassified Clostridium TaxID=2614128 RepID=UPI0015F43CC7|nr:hypothetical protein [Clostridium sp. cel8]MBA5850385.1 hypothetical protein [Clostridium sp. cel8]